MENKEIKEVKKELKKLFNVNGISVKTNEVGNLLINGKEVKMKEYEKMIYDLISDGLRLIIENNEDSEEVEDAKDLQNQLNKVYEKGNLMVVTSTVGEYLNGVGICLGVKIESNLNKDVVVGNNLLNFNGLYGINIYSFSFDGTLNFVDKSVVNLLFNEWCNANGDTNIISEYKRLKSVGLIA